MEASLAEKLNLKALVPTNHSSAADAPRISLANAKRVSIVVVQGTGTSVTGNVLTLEQHNAASSGTTKDLDIANSYYHKIDAATEFTKVDVETATEEYDLHSLTGDDAAVIVFEVLAEDLDRENGFDHISINLGAAGVAKYSSVLYLVDGAFKPAYAETV